jgi:hypothetical protein
MKRATTIIAIFLLAIASLEAQSPRVVLKSIVEGDKLKAVERLEKINIKTRNEMPEMCLLAEAAVLCMADQTLSDMMHGYDKFATHRESILTSENLEKVFKGSDISLEEIIQRIESNSYDAVKAENSEESYRKYLALAIKGEHTELEDIKLQLEYVVHENVLKQRSVEACDEFIAEFPTSKHVEAIKRHRAKILYDNAMNSSNEEILERFIAEYPDYERLSDVTTRLMDMRYKRIVRSENIEQMRWFVDLYPNYKEISRLKQVMANIEYPTLKDSREELEAFIAYYPNVRQISEVKSRLNICKIVEECNIGEIFRYIKQHGYEPSYTRMQRAIFEKHGQLILTDDITKVSLVRFCNKEGKVGYLNLEGRVVVAAEYEYRAYVGMGIPSDKSRDVFECLASRGLAIVIKEGKYGAINSRGEVIIPTQYRDIAFLNNEVACVVSTESNNNGQWNNTTYVCTTYDYQGTKLEDERRYETGYGNASLNNWDTTWFNTNVSIKDSLDEWEKSIYVNGKYVGTAYGGFHTLTPNYRWFQVKGDEKINVIARNGNVVTLNFHSYDIEIIYDNIIMAESISSGNRCVIDLDKQSIISKDKFREMYPMSCNMILVQYIDNSFGFVNRSLSTAITERYDRAYSFSCGTAAVIKGGIGYLINSEGKQVSATYDDIAPLAGHKGLYKVSKSGKCGIIDGNDQIVVPIEYEPAKTGHYTNDKLSSVQSVAGVIEWANGVKTTIFE